MLGAVMEGGWPAYAGVEQVWGGDHVSGLVEPGRTRGTWLGGVWVGLSGNLEL